MIQRLLTRPSDHVASAPPIQVEGVTFRYNGATALRDVSFDLPRGELVAVVGPNGSGKTTLFKIIAGILRPTEGAVRVFGHRPGGHVCIAYVPQRSEVDWDFPVNVTEVVMMGRIRKLGFFRWPRRDDWRLVQDALVRVGMARHAQRQISELSGGQQQRVFLAQALAQEAEVVLLDEPLTGLDLPSQEAIFDALQTLRDAGVTIMIATHDLNLASERFNRAMLLNRRLIAYGDPEDVFSRPNLLDAYGGQVHVLPGEGVVLLADTCCEGEEEMHPHE
jgi:manganese/iron transport system ATP-binding protein